MIAQCPHCNATSTSMYICTACGSPLAPTPRASRATSQSLPNASSAAPPRQANPIGPAGPTALRTGQTTDELPVPAMDSRLDRLGTSTWGGDGGIWEAVRSPKMILLSIGLLLSTIFLVFNFALNRQEETGSNAMMLRAIGSSRTQIVATGENLLSLAQEADRKLHEPDANRGQIVVRNLQSFEAIDAARMLAARNVLPEDQPIMVACATVSQHVHEYLVALQNARPDKADDELREAESAVANLKLVASSEAPPP